MKGMVFAGVLLCAAAAGWGQAPSPEQARPIHAQGCVQAGVEAHCLVLKDADSGKTYNLLIRGQRPRTGIGITFTGVPFRGITSCMEGVAVSVSEWSRNEDLACGSGEPAKP